MSEDDIKAVISAAIAETGAAGMKDIGKVIAALKAKYTGQMDFAKASGLVKAALSSCPHAACRDRSKSGQGLVRGSPHVAVLVVTSPHPPATLARFPIGAGEVR